MTTRTERRMKAPPSTYVAMLITGALAAAALGGAAALFYDENRLMVFTVFAVCTAGPMFALSWFVFVSRYTVKSDPHAEDNVEGQWYDKATLGAFHDFLIVAGLGCVVLALTRFEIAGSTLLVLLLVFVMADAAIRYAVLNRRGA